jgi:hypothetical protein
MPQKQNPLKGRWKIVWMEMWDQEFVDAEVPGHVTLGDRNEGSFHFGYVQGSFTWPDDQGFVDSCWEGNDEMDEARGEIYAEIENGELRGTIEFFNGDESDFRAVKMAKDKVGPKLLKKTPRATR